MANPVLHIKDSYYFEVPKVLWPSAHKSLKDFPAVWVSLDPEFQEWEFNRLYEELKTAGQTGQGFPVAPKELCHDAWHEWVHKDHANHGKPFRVFVEETLDADLKIFDAWKTARLAQAVAAKDEYNSSVTRDMDFSAFLAHSDHLGVEIAHHKLNPIIRWVHDVKVHSTTQLGPNEWDQMKFRAGDVNEYKKEFSEGHVKEWSEGKIGAYNHHLSGKILIPQPFDARLRNLHEREQYSLTNVAISKFMVIEVVVGLILIFLFSWLARRVAHGAPPKGKVWNLLETFVVFIRDQIAEPSIGHHHAHQYTPYLWTVFFFVLGCNLMGLIPWVGAPTGAFAVTSALALLTFGTVVAGGMRQFGFFGFFKNIVPHMDLPWYIAIVIVPMLWVIEFIGLLVKHAVLSIRLLANMVAGHLVLLGLMGIAFSVEAVAAFGDSHFTWSIAAVISVLACTAFSMMELFVAFLQAYVFTFLSALFIGSVLHEH